MKTIYIHEPCLCGFDEPWEGEYCPESSCRTSGPMKIAFFADDLIEHLKSDREYYRETMFSEIKPEIMKAVQAQFPAFTDNLFADGNRFAIDRMIRDIERIKESK